jgi:hypothetical protein
MPKLTISFSLDSEVDKDILRWLKALPKRQRSARIRDAIRDHLGRGGVTLGDVYQAVKDLERNLRKLHSGTAATPHATDGDDWDEPPEASAALDALAQL